MPLGFCDLARCQLRAPGDGTRDCIVLREGPEVRSLVPRIWSGAHGVHCAARAAAPASPPPAARGALAGSERFPQRGDLDAQLVTGTKPPVRC